MSAYHIYCDGTSIILGVDDDLNRENRIDANNVSARAAAL